MTESLRISASLDPAGADYAMLREMLGSDHVALIVENNSPIYLIDFQAYPLRQRVGIMYRFAAISSLTISEVDLVFSGPGFPLKASDVILDLRRTAHA